MQALRAGGLEALQSFLKLRAWCVFSTDLWGHVITKHCQRLSVKKPQVARRRAQGCDLPTQLAAGRPDQGVCLADPKPCTWPRLVVLQGRCEALLVSSVGSGREREGQLCI